MAYEPPYSGPPGYAGTHYLPQAIKQTVQPQIKEPGNSQMISNLTGTRETIHVVPAPIMQR